MLDEEDLKLRQRVARGKYRRLFTHLVDYRGYEWRATFEEIEGILGFALPASAHRHPEWWANENPVHTRHTHSRAWTVAGWETTEVDIRGETAVFRRKR